ncbi:MAG TPA: DUF779 domain-containing protein [Candidatus Binatia bacterium]|jgi:uncharacterized protein (DUF779 family)
MRIAATPRACEVLDAVRAARPGAALTFVFGSGCCEGAAPHLFADYARTREHAEVGEVGGVDVLADSHMRRLYEGRALVIDAEEDPLADGFSAEIPLGWRFTMRVAERSD